MRIGRLGAAESSSTGSGPLSPSRMFCSAPSSTFTTMDSANLRAVRPGEALRRGHQCGSSPPETFRLSAVMYFASSEHRKATASAVSSGRPGRRKGMRWAMAAR